MCVSPSNNKGRTPLHQINQLEVPVCVIPCSPKTSPHRIKQLHCIGRMTTNRAKSTKPTIQTNRQVTRSQNATRPKMPNLKKNKQKNRTTHTHTHKAKDTQLSRLSVSGDKSKMSSIRCTSLPRLKARGERFLRVFQNSVLQI